MAFGGEMEAAGSLDRADALVWAVTDLLIDAPDGERARGCGLGEAGPRQCNAPARRSIARSPKFAVSDHGLGWWITCSEPCLSSTS